MKEFDKWFSKDGAFIPRGYIDAGYEGYVERRAAWKAALEEVYKQLDYSQEHETIKDWIEKELNE